MINYLATLGWNDGTEKEIYTTDELIDAFQLERIVKAPSMFDMTKLRWINAQHLKLLSVGEWKRELEPFLISSNMLCDGSGEVNDKFLEAAVNTSSSKIEVLCDALPIIKASLQYPFLDTLAINDAETAEIVQDHFVEVVQSIVDAWSQNTMPRGDEDDFAMKWKEFVKQLGKKLGRKG